MLLKCSESSVHSFFYARRLTDRTIATSTKPLSCQTSLLFVQEQISTCQHLLLPPPPQLTLNTAHSQPAISHSVTQYTSSNRQALSLNSPSRGGEVKCSHRIRMQASPQHWRSQRFSFFSFLVWDLVKVISDLILSPRQHISQIKRNIYKADGQRCVLTLRHLVNDMTDKCRLARAAHYGQTKVLVQRESCYLWVVHFSKM